MKKIPKGVGMDADPCALYGNQKIGNKHQILLQDYVELQKETESMKERLLIAKQKRLTLLAEVRFLRHRYEFLKSQSSNPKHGLKQPQRNKINRKRDASLKPLARACDLNQIEGVDDRVEAASGRSWPVLHDSSRVFDKEERMCGREREATSNRNAVPIFDLNQISREEEEMEGNLGPLKMLLRSENEGKNSELKISGVCRNVGNASNRAAAKRKISWQDQLALRA